MVSSNSGWKCQGVVITGRMSSFMANEFFKVMDIFSKSGSIISSVLIMRYNMGRKNGFLLIPDNIVHNIAHISEGFKVFQ
jgi:hypothetical protein